MEITKCVVKKDLTPEQPWLSSVVESIKYFLTTMYVYIMKEPWKAERGPAMLWEWNLRLVHKSWSGVLVLDEVWARQQISALAEWPSANVSSAACLHCQFSLWLPFIQRVIMLKLNSVNGIFCITQPQCFFFLITACTSAVNQTSRLSFLSCPVLAKELEDRWMICTECEAYFTVFKSVNSLFMILVTLF